jgi:hypothetical protein
MQKVKQIAKNLLLAFVLVTVGYVIGKETTRRALPPPGSQPGTPAASAERVKVYYLHATVRCVTCNTIEAMTKRLLDSRFKAEMAAGAVTWESADWQKDEELAKRYEVASSVVVVVRRQDGRDAGFQRLDRVWFLLDRPDEFDAYVAEAIDKYLKGGSGS